VEDVERSLVSQRQLYMRPKYNPTEQGDRQKVEHVRSAYIKQTCK